MNNELENKAKALDDFYKSLKKLREEGILTNKKDFTGQIGEWLVAELYQGKRAESSIQKGWDIDVNGKHIQVKTHAKATTNKNRWSGVKKDSPEKIDELIIVVFTHDYKLKEFYKAPWSKAKPLIKMRGKKKTKPEITWNSLKNYRVEIDDLPKQEVVKLFR